MMTVADLIRALAECPPEAQVTLDCPWAGPGRRPLEEVLPVQHEGSVTEVVLA